MSKQITIRPGHLLAPQLDYILLDGSASMQDKWWDTLAGMDQFLNVLKRENIHSHGIATTFDSHNLDMVQRDSTISTWASFMDDPLGSTWGSTPLYDAINLMGRTLRDLDPPKASIVIITDGDENGSATNAIQARSILDWCRAKGWQVTFLGADFNNDRQAKLLGADSSNTAGIRSGKLLEAGKSLGEKRARHALSDTPITFSDEERQTFGGYLTNQSGN